jgi:hypothetical protein
MGDNGNIGTRVCTVGDVTHGGEVQFALADLHHWLLTRIGRLGPCTMILWVGLVLLRFGAITHIVPQLAMIVTAAIAGVTWRCVSLGSLLLSIVELKFLEGLP